MTPPSWISLYRSLPSRVRSPTPANTEKPPFSMATLRMSSMRSTVLPTPAPPNRPVLPPRVYGASRSMTLMPVSNICTRTSCSVKVGGARWMGQYSVAFTGPLSSTGSPTTFRMRPRVALPTGTRMGRRCCCTGTAAGEAVGGVHGDGAHGVLAEVLRDLEGEVVLLLAERGVGDLEGGVDLGEAAGRELHVDHGAQNLGHLCLGSVRSRSCSVVALVGRRSGATSAPRRRRRSPSAPW